MIQNLSESVVVPIAGIIITLVLCYELISMLTERNNLHDVDTWMFFKYFVKASTLNAFYTSPTVIKAMYEALSNMGLSKGNVLEPSCGVGNFMGLVPESMENIKMYGVELDSVSGRIAQQLYQKNKIAVQGFETMQFPDSFFDCVVGNVPFGNYKVPDKRYDRHNFLIHDYFIAKSLDLVRPGGVVAVVTSSGTMDKKDSSVREYLANRADLVGAIRLPNNAFQRNANTSVVADILFLQKRDRAAVERAAWVDIGTTPEGYPINQYFAQHPEMVLGEITTESTQYGKQETTVKPIEGVDLAQQLKAAVENIHLQFLDMLKDVDVYSEVTGKPLQERLYRHMDDAHLSISEMEPYFAYYPDKLYKNLVETRVIYKDIEEEILLEIKKRDGL